MKLMMITNNINQIGGIERVINKLSEYFIMRDIRVSLVSLFSNEHINNFFECDNRVEFFHGSLDYRVTGKSDCEKVIQKAICQFNPDLVMTFHYFICEYVINIRKKCPDFKLVATEHSSHKEYSWKRKLYNCLKIYRKIDQLVTLTEHDQKFYQMMKIPTVCIGNSCSFTTECIAEVKNSIIIAMGRIEEVKGFDMLINAFSIIAYKHPEWELHIFGNGSKKNELINLIRTKKMNNRIFIEPFTKCVEEEMLNSSIFAMSSKSEGFSLVLLEAMECGLPIVAFDLPAFRLLVEDGENGFKASLYDINDFAVKLETLINDMSLRKKFGFRSKQIAKNYRIDRIGEQWIALFTKLLQK